ncbi:MAG: hypothetical protein IPK10_18570 [Bacteroidetes bacterium]|nr:hypothetical protein [Bacteroidota bacterium]
MTNTARMIYQSYDSLNVPNYIAVMYADTCLEVISKCITSNTIIFKANEYTSNGYPSSYSNQHIYVEGDFYMDMNMSFENCIIKTKAGSKLILLGNNFITYFNTSISACDTMWQGIEVRDRGTIYLENLNSIQDAHEAINLGLLGNLFMANSEIINSVTGVKIPSAYPNLLADPFIFEKPYLECTPTLFYLITLGKILMELSRMQE